MLPKLYLHASRTLLEVMPSPTNDTSLKSNVSESVVVELDVDNNNVLVDVPDAEKLELYVD